MIAVVVSVVTALIVYPNNVRQLLKILFVGFLLFGAFVSSRHFNVLPRGSLTNRGTIYGGNIRSRRRLKASGREVAHAK